MKKNKSVREYRSLPYSRKVVRIEEGLGEVYFLARIEEIPWIEADGDTPEEAFLKLDEVFDDALESMIQSGDEIPVPVPWPKVYGYEPTTEKAQGIFSLGRKARPVRVTEIKDLPLSQVREEALVKIG